MVIENQMTKAHDKEAKYVSTQFNPTSKLKKNGFSKHTT